jgi:site-specific recombinase XerD
MHQLAVLLPQSQALPILAAAELDAARSFAEMEKAAATRRAYRSDWRMFTGWCAERCLDPLPASPETTARFLSAQATCGLKASTIGRRAAAIAYAHKLAGFEPPTSAETVRAVVRGIRRSLGTAPVRKSPATAELVQRMLDCCPDTLGGKRDRALLSLGFAGAFRRSELVALTVADLAAVPDGLIVTIRRSKTDQEGLGQTLAVPRGLRILPVLAVETWLEAAGIIEGPLFRPVLKGGRLQNDALAAPAVAAIVKRYAVRAGLDPALFAGHSLRCGYVTSAAESGADLMKICDQTRHRSLEMVRIYIRRVDLFKSHSGAAFL